MKTNRLNGAITALLTPCDKEGNLQFDAILPMVNAQVDAGVVGLFVLGTAGQGPMLTLDERKILLREILKAADNRIAVIAHVGAMPTCEAVNLAKDAVKAGAYAISSVPPVYYRPDAEAVDIYYETISEASSGVPLLAYNNPSATSYDLRPEQVKRLYEAGTIAGVKQASDSVADLHSLIRAGVPVWMASATLNTAALAMGARGTISTITNVIPELFVALFDAMKVGNLQEARELQSVIDTTAAQLRSPIIGALHAGASLRGLPAGMPRRPLRMPNESEMLAIQKILDQVLE